MDYMGSTINCFRIISPCQSTDRCNTYLMQTRSRIDINKSLPSFFTGMVKKLVYTRKIAAQRTKPFDMLSSAVNAEQY